MPTSIAQLLEHAERLITSNQPENAVETYRLALAQDPNNTECLLRLACTLSSIKHHEEAFHHARHLLRLAGDVAFGHFLAGYLARELGRWQDSRRYLTRAVELDPHDLFARVMCCMSSFTICMDAQETLSILHTYEVELDQLIRCTVPGSAAGIERAADGIGALTPFFLPYLGQDVKNLQMRYGAWVCSVMAARYPQFAQQLRPRATSGRVRIGIVSNYFHNHSHWKIAMQGWMEQLDRSRFSLHCFHTGDIADDVTEQARTLADTFLQSGDTFRIASAIYDQGLDALIHSGIGMDTQTIKLAALRLAPVQCTSWGHPVTTGMPTIDYFLSSELMEPENGDEHYAEQLIRLPNLSMHCRPAQPLASAAAAFAIPGAGGNEVIFLCCQNLFKYLPHHDHVFPCIARQAPRARFVFIACHVAEMTGRFRSRIERAFAEHGLAAEDHVSIVPPLNETDYASLNAQADIYLDSIEWSGGNTTLESLPYNKPIVTLPGRFMRGRHTYAMLKMMGVEETIATDVEDYISIASRLAREPQWRDRVSERISRNKHKIYQDRECITAMERFLMRVSGRDHGGRDDIR